MGQFSEIDIELKALREKCKALQEENDELTNRFNSAVAILCGEVKIIVGDKDARGNVPDTK